MRENHTQVKSIFILCSTVCLVLNNIFCHLYLQKELASLGLDRLKQALQALGMKCGGYVRKFDIHVHKHVGSHVYWQVTVYSVLPV